VPPDVPRPPLCQSGRLSFYRDSNGNEVDLLLEFGDQLFPIEVKAGATVSPDYFKGLDRFDRLGLTLPWGGAVVYGGAQPQPRSRWPVHPLADLNTLLEKVHAPNSGKTGADEMT